jgi:hypothetical protein
MKKMLILALLFTTNAFAYGYADAQDAINEQAYMNNQREALEMQHQELRQQEFNNTYNRTFGG